MKFIVGDGVIYRPSAGHPVYQSQAQVPATPASTSTDPQVTSLSIRSSDSATPRHPTPAKPRTKTSTIFKEMVDQDSSPLFRLPPELRSVIYAYAIEYKHHCDDEQCGSNISLLDAARTAPSNELLGTCRRIYTEGKGIFIKAQREFWSTTIFTINIAYPQGTLAGLAHSLDSLCDEQIRLISRIAINVVPVPCWEPFEIYLTPQSKSPSTPWTFATDVSEPSHSRIWHNNVVTVLEAMPGGSSLSHDRACICSLSYANVSAEMQQAFKNFGERGRRGQGDERRMRVCRVCGGGESLYHAMQKTTRSELMVLVAFVCRAYDVDPRT